MKDWFTSLEQRERKFVVTAGAVVTLAILYTFVWMPLTNGYSRMTDGVERWHAALVQLRPLKSAIGGNPANSIRPSNLSKPLVVVVDSTLRIRKLNKALKRSQPTGNNIRVEFENVAFDDLVLWLGDLAAQYALQVQSGSFSASTGTKGRVNAQLTLGR